MKLSEATTGRDNNFNLIRFIAALSVLIAHSFALASGKLETIPLYDALGIHPGDLAVDVFFITSGFLVSASLARRKNPVDFIVARLLRIYPGLLVMLGFTVLIIGPAFTSYSISEYFHQWATASYAIKGASLLFGVDYYLPGVFENNPYKGAINGSLWTMPWELRMYLILLVTWLIVERFWSRRAGMWTGAVVSIFLIAVVIYFTRHFKSPLSITGFRFLYTFFTGATFYALRDKINLKTNLALVLGLLICMSSVHRQVFFVVYTLALGYVVLWAAFIPGGFIRRFNDLGDYSYGIYIYAFPIQQATVALAPGISVFELTSISIAATIIFAVGSWHIVEKRCLRLKSYRSKVMS